MKSSELYKEFLGKDVVVRSHMAGVHVGTLIRVCGRVVILINSRRLWSWTGALDVTAIAKNGVTSAKCSDVDPDAHEVEGRCEMIICAPGVADRIRAL
jgi:hypothetical protein